MSAVRPRLNYTAESGPFRFRYCERNPKGSRGWGVDSIHGDLLKVYQEALQEAYRKLVSPPFNRTPPRIKTNWKLPVYVFALDKWWQGVSGWTLEIMSPALGRPVPLIALPSRFDAPEMEEQHRAAESAAGHELAHVFNLVQRPLHRRVAKGRWVFDEVGYQLWAWMNEGLAVFLESQLFPSNCDWLRYSLDWVDRPDRSLNADEAKYQAGFFLRYLARRTKDDGFPCRLWEDAAPNDSPISCFEKACKGFGIPFCSNDPSQCDIFASGYCVDSYFLWEQTVNGRQNPGYEPEVFKRFGERPVVEYQELQASPIITREQKLDHLACCYYRFELTKDLKRIGITVRIKSGRCLKAELYPVLKNPRRRGQRLALSPQSGSLQAEARAPLTPNEIEHLVLTVTNCGKTTDDDGATFDVLVQPQ